MASTVSITLFGFYASIHSLKLLKFKTLDFLFSFAHEK